VKLLLLWKSNIYYIFLRVWLRARGIVSARVRACRYSSALAYAIVRVALLTLREKRMRPIILSYVTSLASPYFSTLSHTRRDFRKKKLLNINYLFWLSLQTFLENFVIMRRIQRDIVINVKTSSCKVPLFLPDFKESWNFSTDFRKKFKCYI
jgi:hypothetical protein